MLFQLYQHLQLVLCLSALAAHFATFGNALPSVTDNGPASLELDSRQIIEGPLAQFPSGPLNEFLRRISSLPTGERALDASRRILTPLQQRLADAAGVETTRDDVAQGAPCSDVTVVFARGTSEPGNVGLVTGPPFFDALSEQLGDRTLSVQGVEYPASFAGFNDDGVDGVPSMTDFINQAASSCPDTHIVMSGYSQGALVVRSTADAIPAETMARIDSVVTFGDPRDQAPITGAEGKTLTICREDDAVCDGGFINIDHLNYGANASTAAQFVVDRV